VKRENSKPRFTWKESEVWRDTKRLLLVGALIATTSLACRSGAVEQWKPVADRRNIGQGNSVSYRVTDGWLQLRNDSSIKAYFSVHWQCNGGKGLHLSPGKEGNLERVSCDTDSLRDVWLDYFAKD